MDKKRILVVGYYDRANLGDEAYKLSFTKYLEQFSVTFVCIDDVDLATCGDYHALVFGGGDVVNSYFYRNYRAAYALLICLALPISRVSRGVSPLTNRKPIWLANSVIRELCCLA